VLRKGRARQKRPAHFFYSLNVSASSFNKSDAFQPFQTETAFAENEAHVSGVRHRIEIHPGRANTAGTPATAQRLGWR
jgi:hypothetical protein